MHKFKFILKVIMSCRTEDHLQSCIGWIKTANWPTYNHGWLGSLHDSFDLKEAIQEQRLYINRLKELEN